MKKIVFSHLALLGANLIYGINYSVAKDVMPDYIEPFGFILTRVSGALVLFWIIHFISSDESVDLKDMPRLFFCGLFGVALNQLLFFKGLNITTPINASIIMISNPVLVLIVSGLILRERITKSKIIGIILGITGACTLIFIGGNSGTFSLSKTIWGDIMVLINAASYGIYLVIAKPLMAKYHPLTVIKWVFTFGILFVFPVGIGEFVDIEWSIMPVNIIWAVVFVVLGTTFLAYLLNIFALKNVSPSVVSIYLYLQPVIATITALLMQKDDLDIIKIISAILIFVSVYLVSKPTGNRRLA